MSNLSYQNGRFMFALVVVVTLAVKLSVVSGTTLYVAPTGSDVVSCGSSTASPCASLAYAASIASNASQIFLLPGTYLVTASASFPNKHLYINSTTDSAQTILNGASASRFFDLNANENGYISGVTMQKHVKSGLAVSGGCMLYTQSNFSVYNSVFTNCTAENAPGAASVGSLTPETGGAVFTLASSPTFQNVTFLRNYANLAGASMWVDSKSGGVVRDCSFIGETSGTFGASVVPEENSNVTFYNCLWTQCYSKFGGTVDSGGTTTTSFHYCSFIGNSAQRGGAIYHYNADNLLLNGCLFANNSASSNGGAAAIAINCRPTYINCTFQNNTAAGVGAGIYMEASTTAQIRDSYFVGNSAGGGGGGLHTRQTAFVNLTNVRFEKNSGVYGAAELAEDTSTGQWNNVTCVDNHGGTDGGCLGIKDNTNFTIKNSLVHYNSAPSTGGAFLIENNAILSVSDSIFDSNYAPDGGAIIFIDYAVGSLSNVTFTNNTAQAGGAFQTTKAAAVSLAGSLFKNNYAPHGAVASLSSSATFYAATTTFYNNTASFGGVFFVNPSTTNNTFLSCNFTNNKATAGGVFYYNMWRQQQQNSGCSFAGNTAVYGALEATSPYQMIFTSSTPSSISASPKDLVSVSAQLLDFLNNTVTESVQPMIVSLAGSPGLSVDSPILLRAFSEGFVHFSSITVSGVLYNTYNLTLSVYGLPSIGLPVTIEQCGPGYQRANGSQTSNTHSCMMCPSGWYSLVPDHPCQMCPTGGDCNEGGNFLTSMNGWWLIPESVERNQPQLLRCQPGMCLAGSQCAPNRVGTLCSACGKDYSDWGGSCQYCGEGTASHMVLVPFVFGFIYVALLLRFRRLTEAGVPKSASFFLQAVFILLENDNRISSIQILNALNGAFDWMIGTTSTTKCILALDSIQRIAYDYATPLAPLVGVFLWYVALEAYYPLAVHRKMPYTIRGRVMSALMWVLLWGYLLAGRTSFNLLYCIPVGSDVVLYAAPTVVCGSPEHVPYQIIAWIISIVYIAGLPLLCILLLKQTSKRRQVNPDYDFCGELFKSYRGEMFYYEIVVLVRKLALTAANVFMMGIEAQRSFFFNMYFLIILLIQYFLQPFNRLFFNRTEDFLLIILVFLNGNAMADTMRTNYLNSFDFNLTSIYLMTISLALVLLFMLLMFDSVQVWIYMQVRRRLSSDKTTTQAAAAAAAAVFNSDPSSRSAMPTMQHGAVNQLSGDQQNQKKAKGGASAPAQPQIKQSSRLAESEVVEETNEEIEQENGNESSTRKDASLA